MSFSIGIIGLPNAGKSTLFKAITGKNVAIAEHPFTTIDPNLGRVEVPDERLEKIGRIINPEKITKTYVEFVDIAGLVKGAHQGQGLGNQFLSHIRKCDAIVEVVRVFENQKIAHTEKTLNPERDIEIVAQELLMKDRQTLEKSIEKLKTRANMAEKEALSKSALLQKISRQISQGKAVREISLTPAEKLQIKEFQFLTEKPLIYVFNISQGRDFEALAGRLKEITDSGNYFAFDLKIEQEISDFSPAELQELNLASGLDQLISACYNILYLITFFTVAGSKECRAWTLRQGQGILEAGAKVHTDFAEKFILAEIISWDKLLEAKSWLDAKNKGWLKTVGKEYTVCDGDVVEFKINK